MLRTIYLHIVLAYHETKGVYLRWRERRVERRIVRRRHTLAQVMRQNGRSEAVIAATLDDMAGEPVTIRRGAIPGPATDRSANWRPGGITLPFAQTSDSPLSVRRL